MRDNYDFSDAIKNPFADREKGKYTVTIHYDFSDKEKGEQDKDSVLKKANTDTMQHKQA